MHPPRGFALTHAWPVMDHKPLRILLADDNANMRRLVASDLRKDGSTVIEVADGRQALDLFRKSFEDGSSHWFDVVVSDLKMPEVSGLKLLSALRQERCHVPFILITACADPEVDDQARRLGAWTVLQKPVDLESLCLAVHRAV